MLLADRLARSTLGDVMAQLFRARASGVLVLEESLGARAGVRHAVHLVEGTPRAVDSDGPRIGEVLAGRGDLDPAIVATAVRRKRGGDDRLTGELLCALGSSPEVVSVGLAQQTRARLEPLFHLGDARLWFRAALFDDVAPRAWVRAARGARGLGPEDFLHGRPRARQRSSAPACDRLTDLRVLGVPATAGAATIRDAFKRRVLELHPDRAADEDDRRVRTQALARVVAAYQRLLG